MQGLVDVPIASAAVMRLAQLRSGAVSAARGAGLGAQVVAVHRGKTDVTTPINHRVDKLRVVKRVPGHLYWYLGFDNYAIWALQDSGSSYTLVSRGLCRELGLPIQAGGTLGSYKVADG